MFTIENVQKIHVLLTRRYTGWLIIWIVNFSDPNHESPAAMAAIQEQYPAKTRHMKFEGLREARSLLAIRDYRLLLISNPLMFAGI